MSWTGWAICRMEQGFAVPVVCAIEFMGLLYAERPRLPCRPEVVRVCPGHIETDETLLGRGGVVLGPEYALLEVLGPCSSISRVSRPLTSNGYSPTFAKASMNSFYVDFTVGGGPPGAWALLMHRPPCGPYSPAPGAEGYFAALRALPPAGDAEHGGLLLP